MNWKKNANLLKIVFVQWSYHCTSSNLSAYIYIYFTVWKYRCLDAIEMKWNTMNEHEHISATAVSLPRPLSPSILYGFSRSSQSFSHSFALPPPTRSSTWHLFVVDLSLVAPINVISNGLPFNLEQWTRWMHVMLKIIHFSISVDIR